MAGTVVADNIQAASTSTLVLKNGVANTPPTIQDSSGTQIGTFCRAWVNFNGTGVVAIRASFNVKDITDNGTGDYTVNFQTATPMPDANYAGAVTGGLAATTLATDIGGLAAPTASACRIGTRNAGNGVLTDFTYVNVAIFR